MKVVGHEYRNRNQNSSWDVDKLGILGRGGYGIVYQEVRLRVAIVTVIRYHIQNKLTGWCSDENIGD